MARAFRESDPTGFAAYVRDLDQAMRDGKQSDAMMRAAVTLHRAAEGRLATLPDDYIRQYYELRRDEMLSLRDTNPQSCRPLFRGEPTSDPPMTDAIANRRLSLYEQAFRAEGTFERAPLTDEEWDAAIGYVRERTMATVGGDIDLLSPQTDLTGREARSCEVIAELYNQISVQPEPGRFFLSDRGGPT